MIKTLFQKLMGSKEEKSTGSCCSTMTLERPVPSSNENASSCSGTCCGSTSTTVDVVITSAILNRVLVVKALKEITGKTDAEANELFEARPGIIKTRIEREEAEAIKEKLEELGATIELR